MIHVIKSDNNKVAIKIINTPTKEKAGAVAPLAGKLPDTLMGFPLSVTVAIID